MNTIWNIVGLAFCLLLMTIGTAFAYGAWKVVLRWTP